MRTGFTQAGRLVQVTTPLGANDLLVDAMQGSEGLSELFSYTLTMRSGQAGLDPSAIVGKELSVKLQAGAGVVRYVQGLCSRFVHSGFDRDFATYEAQVVPRLSLLQFSRDRRIFQGKSVDAIVKAVLQEFQIALSVKLTQTYAVMDYCVQYDESAFDFISRLMEQAGIFYYFTFTASGHTLVLADSGSAFSDCAGAAAMRWLPRSGAGARIDALTHFAREKRLALKSAVADDYDFEKPSTSLAGSYSASSGEGNCYEFATGHASVSAGASRARLRVESSQVQAQVLRGESFAYPFAAGTRFKLQDHFVAALNTTYVLRRVSHHVRGDGYRNTFEAFAASVPFRPPLVTALPRATGCETARVVGPSGEEIWTDKYGRIKVQFPWDRQGKKDDQSSTWIRVAQSTADNGFGALVLPRVGQEVVVTYLNGDPQRPLVTGCVYNGENAPPVTLPGAQTQTVWRTRSSKQGQAGNELRLEDKKDAEAFYLHAQKDMTFEIENALSTTVKKGQEIHVLEEGDRSLELKKGRESHKVHGTRTVDITGDETHTSHAAFSHTVDGDYTLTVKGKLTLHVTGALSIQTSADGLLQAGTGLTVKAGTDLNHQAGTNLSLKAGVNLQQQAGAQLDIKAPVISSKADANQTLEAGALLALKGAMVKAN
jgi:type VI secretion system secreted protein VgrG